MEEEEKEEEERGGRGRRKEEKEEEDGGRGGGKKHVIKFLNHTEVANIEFIIRALKKPPANNIHHQP